MKVQLSIFSGNPDPVLELPPDQQQELARRIVEAVGKESADRAEPPALGYRGFVVESSGEAEGLPSQTTVFNGTITVLGAEGQESTFRDAAEAEGLLLEAAGQGGFGEILEEARAIPPNA